MKEITDQLLSERLKEMAEVDIRAVHPEDLVDIGSVEIRKELPVPERVNDFIEQIQNPYCYLSHGIIVKISFAGERRLEECLQDCISMEI